jgi:hypothetical protein
MLRKQIDQNGMALHVRMYRSGDRLAKWIAYCHGSFFDNRAGDHSTGFKQAGDKYVEHNQHTIHPIKQILSILSNSQKKSTNQIVNGPRL